MTIRLISGFPGIGKTQFQQRYRDHVLDIDSSGYAKGPTFADDYYRSICDYLERGWQGLVSSHVLLRERLHREDVAYYLVYPQMVCKDTYFARYHQRGDNCRFLHYMDSQWERLIESCKADTHSRSIHVRLEPDEFLSDRLYADSQGFYLRPPQHAMTDEPNIV